MLFLSDLDSLARPSLIEYVSIEVLKGFFFRPIFGRSYWERFKMFVNKQEELLGVQGILSEWKTKSSCFLFRGPVVSPSYIPLLNLLCFFVIIVSFFGG
jgi:hypothetical protein